MNIGFDDTFSFEKVSNLIIDMGLKLTKIGLGSESEPRKIIKTPEFFDYDKFMKDDTKNQMNILTSTPSIQSDYTTMLSYRKDLKDLKFEIESFIYNIFYNVLQIKKQQRDKNYVCIISIDFSLDRVLLDVYEMIVKCILENPLIFSVRLLPKVILPIFTSGFSSGIVIDVGYAFTTITPINNGFPYLNKSENLSIGSLELEKTLKRLIVEENIISGKRKIKNVDNFLNNINKHLSDLVVRCTVCINKKLSVMLNNPTEEAKLKNDNDCSKIDFLKDVQDFQVSFLSRVKLGEKFFGNIENDEINIVYSLLKVILNLNNEDRKKLSQNIILCGGSSMLIGFYKRLIDEIASFVDDPEFEEIKQLKDYIKVHKIIFPRNCLTWIGASLVSGFDKLNVKQFTVSREDFENYEKEELENYAGRLPTPIEKIFNYFQ